MVEDAFELAEAGFRIDGGHRCGHVGIGGAAAAGEPSIRWWWLLHSVVGARSSSHLINGGRQPITREKIVANDKTLGAQADAHVV